MNVNQGNSIYFFWAIHNSCKPSVKHRYSCFTTSSGGRCPPHSPPAREITSPLTPECRLRRFFIIYLKVNAVAVLAENGLIWYDYTYKNISEKISGTGAYFFKFVRLISEKQICHDNMRRESNGKRC